MIRRREFITLLGSATAARPLAARAQQSKLPTIGYLGANTPSAAPHWVAAFVQRLRELGWIDGRNLAIEYRWAKDPSPFQLLKLHQRISRVMPDRSTTQITG